ncbi:glutathione S-transferase family protein [Aliikangiella maris]|uniref:Glutathione S-transferase family protein n=2 Tax=Aliikangiella maris TaxID=3162458 RepID=A0ABV3MTC5_9GAMM
MLTLYTFGSYLGMPDPSPFVLKVDAYLRLANIEFAVKPALTNSRRAPKGKLPFIKDNNKTVADSQFILEYLESYYDVQLDAHLTDEQKATAYLITKSLDENLYFILVYSRWYCEKTWPQVKQAFFGKFPFPIKQILPNVARKGVLKTLHNQGISRHSRNEIEHITARSFQALADLIGEKPFIFGDKPCSLDATVYAFLAEFILAELDNSFNSLAKQHQGLVKYCQRFQQTYYRD